MDDVRPVAATCDLETNRIAFPDDRLLSLRGALYEARCLKPPTTPEAPRHRYELAKMRPSTPACVPGLRQILAGAPPRPSRRLSARCVMSVVVRGCPT